MESAASVRRADSGTEKWGDERIRTNIIQNLRASREQRGRKKDLPSHSKPWLTLPFMAATFTRGGHTLGLKKRKEHYKVIPYMAATSTR